LSLIVAIVEVVRFGFDYAGHGNSGPHGDGAVGRKLDCVNWEFRSLSGAEDAADNTLMMENFAFGHSRHPPLKIVE
jgi:hypothetical protein